MCPYMHPMHTVPAEARRGCQIIWNWRYKWLLLGPKEAQEKWWRCLLASQSRLWLLTRLSKHCK